MKTPAQIIRELRKGKKSFTLIEVIIASSIFTVVSLIGVLVFTNIARIQKRIYLESAIYEDGRFLMERISREIRQNTVDYEEYYNRLVKQADFGRYQGCYASRFYNPGSSSSIGPGPGRIGAWCSVPANFTPQQKPGCIIDKTTLDINTGQNPHAGGLIAPNNDAASANAMCDLKFASTGCTMGAALNDQSQLYLIDAKGMQKTLIALKKTKDTPLEYALSMLQLDGIDNNNDGIYETWYDAGKANYYCDPAYNCDSADFAPSGLLTDNLNAGTDPTKLWQGFVPISPLRTNIKSIHFYISPLEDPRKAFAENDPAIQQQPHVTVVMTLTPASSELSAFGGTPPTITLQNTISSRIYNEVKSYTGMGECGAGNY